MTDQLSSGDAQPGGLDDPASVTRAAHRLLGVLTRHPQGQLDVTRIRSAAFDAAMAVAGPLIGLAFAFNVMKGVPTGVAGIMWPNWEVTYRYGFIRRALMGTLLQSLAAGMDRAAQLNIVLYFHGIVCATLFSGIAIWIHTASKALPRETRLLALTGLSAVLLTQFVATTVQLAGYLDIYLFVVALAGAHFAFKGRYLEGGLVVLVGPLIHDGFVFLWLPVFLLVVMRVWRSPGRLFPILCVAAPFLVCAVSQWLHSQERAFKVIDELPQDLRHARMAYAFTFRTAVVRMFHIISDERRQFVLAVPVFCLPSILAAGCGYWISGVRSVRRFAFLIAVALSPCGILLIGWDLSRFLVWSTLGGFFVLAWSLSHSPLDREQRSPAVSRRLVGACATLMALLTTTAVGGPLLFSYFDVTFANYPVGWSWMTKTPGAQLAYAWLEMYHREKYSRGFLGDRDKCRIRGLEAGASCTFAVDPAHPATTDPLWLAPGAYDAQVDVTPLGKCARARGNVELKFDWRLSPTVRGWFEPALGSNASMHFVVTDAAASMGRLRAVVSAETGCYVLNEIRIVSR